ncbi:MAG: 3-dehydroquinate synthase [Bacteroidetes bacterium]|nr:MAG: 3-dehydroquinate synthase [Bacteroidota bacterium]
MSTQLISDIIFTNNISDLPFLFDAYTNKKTFILVDENTRQYCYPLLEKYLPKNTHLISIKSGEENKNIETLKLIWEALSKNGADRKSLLINLGGGVIGDMGGFAASTFKRGIDFINIPTTLLSQVDASVGGKTGFDFLGLKNEIGCFNAPVKVIIYPEFLKTLDNDNIISGFAEMIKHALIFDAEHYGKLKEINLNRNEINYEKLLNLIKKSVQIKEYFVKNDPYEANIRKALNFGHTFGHAIESFLMNTDKELLHGKAVAFGMIFELFLSNKKCSLPINQLLDISEYITNTYGRFEYTKDNYEAFYKLMQHDKKNDNEEVNFTLLSDIGKAEINQTASKQEVFEAFDFYLQLK